MNRIQFYTTEEKFPHGEVTIYQYKENFIAKIVSLFEEKKDLQKKVRILNVITHISRHFPIVYKIESAKTMTCSHNFSLVYYISHYNYTLDSYMKKSLKKQAMLNDGEIWYILRSLAEAGSYLQSHKIVFKKLDKKSLWVSPTFEIKIEIEDLFE